MKTLTADQLAAFFREAKNSGVFEMYYLELATGLRRGELLGLKWEDINLETGIIQIKRQVARINGKVVEAPLKTKNSYRTLSIGADAIEILKEQRNKVAGEYVFQSSNGGPNSPDSVLHVPPGIGESWIATLAISRFEEHVFDPGTPKWCRHQDGIRYAGPLQCRVHPGPPMLPPPHRKKQPRRWVTCYSAVFRSARSFPRDG